MGEASDGVEAVGKAEELKPDVVIMDVTLPEMSGLLATPKIKKVLPNAEVLIFTQHDSTQMVREALECRSERLLAKISGKLATGGGRGDEPT